MYKNKTNIEIVQSYLDGTKLFPVFGYTPPIIKRNIGDEWVEKGITWRQENGYKTRVNSQADLIRKAREETCKHCGGDMRWGSKLDQLFFSKTGLCENCLIDYETKLRIAGIYPEYEKYKLISNEIGYLKDVLEKIKELIKYFTENNGDVEMICNSEGFIEKWKNTNKDQVLKDANADLKLGKQRIALLTKEKNNAKKKYINGTKKYNLNAYA